MKKVFPVLGILFAISAVLLSHPSLMPLLWQPSSFCIVVGATLGVTVAQSSSMDLYTAASMLKWLWAPPQAMERRLPEQVYEWAKAAKKEGTLYYERLAKTQSDAFMRNALLLLADNPKAIVVRDELSATINSNYRRHREAIKVFESAAGYAPTIGIIGSVLGMLAVLSSGGDIQESYSDIGMAFVSTFYGLSMANLVLLPIAHRLKAIADNTNTAQEIISGGVQMLAENKSAILVRDTIKKAMEENDVFA